MKVELMSELIGWYGGDKRDVYLHGKRYISDELLGLDTI